MKDKVFFLHFWYYLSWTTALEWKQSNTYLCVSQCRSGPKCIRTLYYYNKFRRLFSLWAITVCTLSLSVISSCICFCFVLFFLMPSPQQSNVGFLKEVKHFPPTFQWASGMSDVSTKLIACNNENMSLTFINWMLLIYLSICLFFTTRNIFKQLVELTAILACRILMLPDLVQL